MLLTLACTSLLFVPSDQKGASILAEVDRRLDRAGGYSVRVTNQVDGRVSTSVQTVLIGGYVKVETEAELLVQTPSGSWSLDKQSRTQSTFQPGEMILHPFLWHRTSQADVAYGPVTEREGSFHFSMRQPGSEDRVEMSVDRATYLPKGYRYVVGTDPEVEKIRVTYSDYRLGLRLTPADFPPKPPAGVAEAPKVAFTDRLIKAGAKAPDFSLKLTGGGSVTLKQALKKRKAVLLAFWFYSCAPCREELPDLIDAHRRFSKDGLLVLPVNVADSEAVAARYYRKVGVPFPSAMASGGHKMVERYGVTGCPSLVLVDSKGKVRSSIGGFRPGAVRDVLERAGFVYKG